MDNFTAMEYLADLMNVYLSFIPVTKQTQKEIRIALSHGISAIKTLEDMKTKGE